MERRTESFDRDVVLRVLQDNGGSGLVWSVIAARILGCERSKVTMPQVRGVRDVVRSLQTEGLVRELRPLVFAAG